MEKFFFWWIYQISPMNWFMYLIMIYISFLFMYMKINSMEKNIHNKKYMIKMYDTQFIFFFW